MFAAFLAGLGVAACAHVPRDAGYGEVSADVRAAVGAAPAWPQSVEAEAQARADVDAALAEEVTPDSAARLALINSPRVRAAMEGLGVARADFLLAARPPNPVVSFVGLSRQQPGPFDLQIAAAIPLLDLILLPGRIREGRARFALAETEATAAVIDIAVQARAALTDYIALRETADFYAQASDAARAGEAAAQAIYAAGNSAKVDLDRERLFAAETAADQMQAEAAVAPARERVNAVLGLSGPRAAGWRAAIRLPAPPEAPVDVAAVQARALQASFTLRSADARLRAVAARRGVADLASVLQDLDVQYDYDRDDLELKRGGGVSLAAPIFDLGQAERLRASSEVRQAYQARRAVEAEVLAQVRAAAGRAEALRKLALYRRRTVLAISNDVFTGAQLDANAAQIGVFALLQAKRDNLDAGRQAIAALRDYWNAWTELQGLAATGPLAGADHPSPASFSQSAPPTGGR